MTRLTILLSALVLIAPVALACDDTDEPNDTGADADADTDADTDTDTDPVFEELKADVERDTAVDATPEEAEAMRLGNAALGFDLLHVLAKQRDDNFALSTYSIRGAFGMLQAAAAGQTEAEIADVMGFLEDPSRLHNALGELDLALRARNLPGSGELEPVILETANQLFTRLDRPVPEEYLEVLARSYGAGVLLADFAGNPEGERKRINTWVERRTHDRIVDLIPAGSIQEATAWVLVNAVYLKAPWLDKFGTDFTHDEDFTLLDGSTVKVPTMHADANERTLAYVDGEGYKLVELPLRGEELVATFLLPDAGAYAQFEASLDATALDEMLAARAAGRVKVALPKFQIDTGSIDLKPILVALGMPNAFTDAAEFPGFGADLPPTKIDFVYHSVFAAMDEAGVEAAAATAIGGVDTGIPEIDMDFDAYRPFLFLIRDETTGHVLFLGRVLDPSK